MLKSATTIHRFDAVEAELSGAMSRKRRFAAKGFAKTLGARLDAMLARDGAILSLDVFDTLILRDNSSELTRFFEIGGLMADIVNADAGARGNGASKKRGARRGAREVRQVDAFVARHLGTQASYRASVPVDDCREGSLSEIHVTASRLLAGTDLFADAFIAAELEYEAGRLSANDTLLAYARTHRARGGRVVLLTDMYMHRPHVEHLLAALGIDCDGFDAILSSADSKVSKASGGVFALMEQQMKAEPAAFVHVGDSLLGDFQRPRACGWQALHVPLAEADLVERRRDHLATEARLAESFGLVSEIAMPR